MQNIRKFTSGRRRLLTSTVVAFAAVGAAALTAVSIPANASTNSDFRAPVFRSPTQVASISVATIGYTRWRAGGVTGEVGTPEAAAVLDICYTYPLDNNGIPVNNGGLVPATDMYAYVSQAPGKQDPTRTLDDHQGSNPTFLGGATMSINTFTSTDCTEGLVKEVRGLTVPDSGRTFDLDLN